MTKILSTTGSIVETVTIGLGVSNVVYVFQDAIAFDPAENLYFVISAPDN